MQAKKVPQRQCIGCRESQDKKELIRIVKTKEGEILLDRSGRLNGRGAYLFDSRDCFEQSRRSNALNRTFKMNVQAEVYDEIERQFYDPK